jgi:acetyl-CoA carboxylase biotin carboxyl carrier protein
VELKDIKAIIDLMKKNSITEFEMEQKDSKIRLKRGLGNVSTVPQNDESSPVISLPNLISAPTTPSISTSNPNGEIEIKSPMIGTFYRSPSPEAASYIEVGSEVSVESVVCIIEAMKVMNEIKSEVKGFVTQALVENGKPVEFGQPLFKLRPA